MSQFARLSRSLTLTLRGGQPRTRALSTNGRFARPVLVRGQAGPIHNRGGHRFESTQAAGKQVEPTLLEGVNCLKRGNYEIRYSLEAPHLPLSRVAEEFPRLSAKVASRSVKNQVPKAPVSDMSREDLAKMITDISLVCDVLTFIFLFSCFLLRLMLPLLYRSSVDCPGTAMNHEISTTFAIVVAVVMLLLLLLPRQLRLLL